MKLIYVADDDQNICRLLKNHIESSGFEVHTFYNAMDLLGTFRTKPCDLIITDIMMPEMSGYDLCREIRKESMVPVFMVSANNDEIDRVLGLELGADDYISKPISFRELIAKIKNQFRRIDLMKDNNVTQNSSDILSCSNLKLNKQSRVVIIDNKEMKTTAKEFDLLEFFLSNLNVALSRERIIERIWGYDYFGETRQVDHMIKRLRKKLLEHESRCLIETVWGYGYKMGDIDEKQY